MERKINIKVAEIIAILTGKVYMQIIFEKDFNENLNRVNITHQVEVIIMITENMDMLKMLFKARKELAIID